ncbi:MAG: HD domain-containing phosphohydrolase [Bacillota bacterium]
MNIFIYYMERLRNLSLWIKISAMVSLFSIGVFVALGYIGWQIIMDQQAQIVRVDKLHAIDQILHNEIARTRMVTRLLASDLPSSEGYSGERIYNIVRNQKLLLVLDVEFIYLYDKSGEIILSESPGYIVEPGWQMKITRHAFRGGEAVAGLETLPPMQGKSEPRLAVVAAVPIQDDKNNSVRGVLVLGHTLEGQPPYLRQVSEESQEAVSIFAQDKLVSYSAPEEIPLSALKNSLTQENYRDFIAQGKPYYGWLNVGGQRYITAFKPLYDVEGQVVGASSIAFEQTPLLDLVRAFFARYSMLAGLVFLMFLLSFHWLYIKVNRPLAALVKGASAISFGNLAVRIPVAREIKCWQIKNCGQTTCPAFGNNLIRCWFHSSNYCCEKLGLDHRLNTDCCESCVVYRIYRGNQLDQLGDTFNFMAAAIEHEQEIRQKAYDGLQAQNEVLNAQQEDLQTQQEELQAQTECLMSLNKQLENTLEELDSSQNIIYTLVLALEARDHYTRGHSERVARYAVALGVQIGLDAREQELLRRAAILHDLGKIGVHDNILSKPARLDDEEMRMVQEHPVIGERICRPLKTASEILPIIRHHHEWFNGKGYPDGLSGEGIPLGARIMAIVDAYDAMISDRPYRKGMLQAEAREELHHGAGTQWDASLVNELLIMLDREVASWPPENTLP